MKQEHTKYTLDWGGRHSPMPKHLVTAIVTVIPRMKFDHKTKNTQTLTEFLSIHMYNNKK